MSDDEVRTRDCPTCHEPDAVTYLADWEPPDWGVGVWGGWGVTELTEHCPLTKQQRHALEDAIARDLELAHDHAPD